MKVRLLVLTALMGAIMLASTVSAQAVIYNQPVNPTPVVNPSVQPVWISTKIVPNNAFRADNVIIRGRPETTWGFIVVSEPTERQGLLLPASEGPVAVLPASTFTIVVDGHVHIGTVTRYGTDSVKWTLTAKQTRELRAGWHTVTVTFNPGRVQGITQYQYRSTSATFSFWVR